MRPLSLENESVISRVIRKLITWLLYSDYLRPFRNTPCVAVTTLQSFVSKLFWPQTWLKGTLTILGLDLLLKSVRFIWWHYAPWPMSLAQAAETQRCVVMESKLMLTMVG